MFPNRFPTRARLRYGFAQVGLERIMAVAVVDNYASRRVLEKLACGTNVLFVSGRSR